MKTIKQLAPKPSDALQAMVDGLLTQNEREDFKIDMQVFGKIDEAGKICFGCAATCAIQQLTGKNFTPENDAVGNYRIKADFLEVDKRELGEFEYTMDNARKGDLKELFYFYDLEDNFDFNKYNNRFFLTTVDWEEQLPAIRELIEFLRSEGL